jgi:hypothetical protein
MQGQNGERWRELCEQAAIEQDPQRLLELMREINDLLEAKERRLLQRRSTGNPLSAPESGNS